MLCGNSFSTNSDNSIIYFIRDIMKKPETITEYEYRLKQEAKRLAEANKDKKVTKYDLK